ncbi:MULTISPECIES: PLP-dependent aminotransferase family protein [Clostridium]|uniref:Transcriptional regulator, GntR family/aminotransferase n=1 Tax=Clostridium botulinum (strain Eklund 17B / Type B) TaxID=935198 RepID=B2TMM1_CLOBB|nr:MULTISPECIES: PLP-dependent aminotransferase family protein [Clostridium]ACD24309.1 transcriptional regulator, GntR family/aminotransferase [Clostridium botulinum B str. Eklund 17B (NRP)]MBN1044638.1 PLP-dependent aminotransferase family protein [Clostridium botulinum]MBN1051367.1 PLP-dependent aminotransferase family protein [Clostridium botulinum]MBY6975164.1 PLP-dependent aminotransferase family protein [Clostridium botulinum]MBY7000145.1 PLP-dependent aminotransferase family protein [Cl
MGEYIKLYKEIKFEDEIPKYIQISNFTKSLIEKKVIKDKEKLPTIRELAKALEVNSVTIVNAYNKLKAEGYAYQKVGSGTYAKVKEFPNIFRREYLNTLKKLRIDELHNIVDFTGETNTEVLFPIEDLKKIIDKVLDRDGANALISNNSYGYKNLISTINNVFWDNQLNEEDILIVSGAQQGIDIVSKGILNINDNVVVEKPTYGGALSVFKWKKANIFEVPIKEDGIDLDKFEKILQKNNIRCFYTMSYFQNPTGVSYSLEKKKRILELAEIYDFYIMEDDYLSELIYEKSIEYIPFKWLDRNERVIYIKSFSKIFLPGIRLGYLVAPEIFRESLQNSKFNTDITTSSLMQRALDIYIYESKWKENIKALNIEYSKRYNIMQKILDNDFRDLVSYIDPRGGLNFYLTLKDSKINSKELFLRLRKKSVYITPGIMFFTSHNDGKNTFRIGFYQTDEDKIIKGLNILREELIKCHI